MTKLILNIVIALMMMAGFAPANPAHSEPVGSQAQSGKLHFAFLPLVIQPPQDCVSWGSEDDASFVVGDAPLGDKEAYTLVQYWDGRNVSSTTHVLIAPGYILRIPAPVSYAKWHIWSTCQDGRQQLINRFYQMVDEVKARDNVTPKVFIINDKTSTLPSDRG
jgi:hypothetical protein